MTELGWDDIVCVASTIEAAAFYLEFDSVEELKKDKQYRIQKHRVVTQEKEDQILIKNKIFDPRGSLCPICRKDFRRGCNHSVEEARKHIQKKEIKDIINELSRNNQKRT